ncbi:hypothetical protein B0A48_11641 [Cryoendolithus antarcticus]|uniref:Non-haem dioxygenase N-terminal domain-containing protein n=1 Tax=Cryoendolithus antarcticus TaxID=1507870 RepID=A0A1V8SSQ3_9PEZI|nr:hypothetical protein B0A48_11641 [Cryoendolithus antarcticus]
MSTTTTEAPRVQHSLTPSADVQQCDYSNLTPYQHPPETKESLPWSDNLNTQFITSVKNYGLADEQVQQQFTLAKAFFELPVVEKEKHEVDYANADYNGWRGPGRRSTGNAFDNIEIFNTPK